MGFFQNLVNSLPRPNIGGGGSGQGGLFGGGGITGVFNNVTNGIVSIFTNRQNRKWDRLAQQDGYNYSLSMNDKGLIGRDGNQRDFGKNMRGGIESTFGQFSGLWGGNKGKAGAISPAILGVGIVALFMFVLIMRKKNSK